MTDLAGRWAINRPTKRWLPAARQDIAGTIRYSQLWYRLGLRDIRGRYRRTTLGPFWTSLNAALLIGALGLVYALLWHIDVAHFLPFFSGGYVSWVLVTAVISESCAAFTGSETVIRTTNLPYGIHIMRVLWRNLIVFGHALVVHVAVLTIFRVPITGWFLMAPIGLALVMTNLAWVGLLAALACARFRDLVQVVANVLQMAFFVTPIFWPAERLGDHPWASVVLVDGNIFYHLVDVLRAPLLGEVPAASSCWLLVAMAAVGWGVALLVFDRCRNRVVYWV